VAPDRLVARADLFLTGRTIDVDEALRIGLVDRVSDTTEDTRTATQTLAEQIASLPAGTAEATKQVLRSGLDSDFLTAREVERAALADRTNALRAARKAKDARDASA
jgi:enoyl-CoA hydratase/carnithine racemase